MLTAEITSPCLERLQLQKSATPTILGLHLTSSSGLSMYSSSVPGMTNCTIMCAELWEGLVSRLQQQSKYWTGESPFKLFGLSLVMFNPTLWENHIDSYSCSASEQSIIKYGGDQSVFQFLMILTEGLL